jgi:hypothetical protein
VPDQERTIVHDELTQVRQQGEVVLKGLPKSDPWIKTKLLT